MNVRKTDEFIADVEQQSDWYAAYAGWEVADHYLDSVQATCQNMLLLISLDALGHGGQSKIKYSTDDWAKVRFDPRDDPRDGCDVLNSVNSLGNFIVEEIGGHNALHQTPRQVEPVCGRQFKCDSGQIC